MAGNERWYYTSEQLANSPSIKHGMDKDTELNYRQRAANLIQEMGQRIQVSQLCINTAIVYMHRFYVYHSFTHFHRNSMAAASLFLAAKVEEQPRKIEHIIKALNACLNGGELTKERYSEQAQDLVFNENILLQTLGFDVAIDHPHTHVVKTMQLVNASKDLAQTSYFLASNSLHLTTMCLQYKPTIVAAFCIHLACQWSSWMIPTSIEGKSWFTYVDKSITTELLTILTDEFLSIFEKSNCRIKNKMQSMATSSSSSSAIERIMKEESSSSNPAASGHHKHHHHSHHPSHSKDHRSHKQSIIGDNKLNPQASSSSSSSAPGSSKVHQQRPHHQQQQAHSQQQRSQQLPGQQPGQSNSSGVVNPHRDRNHRMDRIPPTSAVSVSSAGNYQPGSVKVPGHDGSKRPSIQNIHDHSKNRHSLPGQIPGAVVPPSQNPSSMQKPPYPDQRHSSSKQQMPAGDLMKKAKTHPQDFPQKPQSNPSSTNKLPNNMYPQSGIRSSSQPQQSSSVLIDSSKASFSFIDESSDLLENSTPMPSKKSIMSIFDPEFNDAPDMSLKTIKPNKDSPSKDKMRRDKTGESKTPSKRPQSSLTIDNQKSSTMRPHSNAPPPMSSSSSQQIKNMSTEDQRLYLQQQRHQVKPQINPNLFQYNPSQKRQLEHNSNSNEAKKAKITNNFYLDDFDQVYGKDPRFADNIGIKAENMLFSGNGNGNGNQSSNDFSGMLNDTSSSSMPSHFDIGGSSSNVVKNETEIKKEVDVRKEIEIKKEPELKKESSSVVASSKETNPDFVKSLLQESLSKDKLSDFSLYKNATNIPLELPDEVLADPVQQPSMPVSLSVPVSMMSSSQHSQISSQNLLTQPTNKPENSGILTAENSSVAAIRAEDNNSQSSDGGERHRKKEKKKKEKHKHKDRSRDKEERKKHKKEKSKEKDRHKNKESNPENPVKVIIKAIPPTSDEQPPSSSLKIKIPKEKIPQPEPKSLKITISKEKFKAYDGSSSSSSHKKKDKDRDKDRERSKHSKSINISNEYNNGSNGGNSSKINGSGNDFNRYINNTAMNQQAQTLSQPMLSISVMPPQQILQQPHAQQQQLLQQNQSQDQSYDFGNMGVLMNKMPYRDQQLTHTQNHQNYSNNSFASQQQNQQQQIFHKMQQLPTSQDHSQQKHQSSRKRDNQDIELFQKMVHKKHHGK